MEKIDVKNFIKIPRPNDIDYRKSMYEHNMSDKESNTIWAYQIERGIEIIRDSGEKRLADRLVEKNKWVMGWRKYYDNFSQYWQHLKRVCDNCECDKKAPSEYTDKWLLNWDRNYADRAIANKRKILSQ